jgi:hypothetical protein
MIPNVVRGSNAVGLMHYLSGGGRTNEHRDQHLVAGDPTITMAYGFGQLTPELATAIGRDLEEPWRVFGTEITTPVYEFDDDGGRTMVGRADAHMWHASLSLSADEGEISDAEWGAVAQDFVDKMGFTEASGKAACRWVAVRHGLSKNGNDHIHIGVSLVREDGTKASTHRDFDRAQKVCRELEQSHGLNRLEARDAGLGARGEKPAERVRAERENTPDVSAKRLEGLVRSAAVIASDEAEFVRQVRAAGVIIRPRYAAGRTDVVVGYSVAEKTTDGASPIWYGGGRLARDLTLPRLRQGWPDSPTSAQDAVDEWRSKPNPWILDTPSAPKEPWQPGPELWSAYTDELRDAVERLRTVPIDDKSAWAHVARDTAGVFFSWSNTLEKDAPGPLNAAARQLARSAHIRADVSKHKPAQFGSMSGAARLLASASVKDDSVAIALLVAQLMRTTGALVGMHMATGELRMASDLAQTMERALVDVHARLPEHTLSPATASRAESFDPGRQRSSQPGTVAVEGPGHAGVPANAPRESMTLDEATAWMAEHHPEKLSAHQLEQAWTDFAPDRERQDRAFIAAAERAKAATDTGTRADPSSPPANSSSSAEDARRARLAEAQARVRFEPVDEPSAVDNAAPGGGLVESGPYKGMPVFPDAMREAGISELAWRTAQGHLRPKGRPGSSGTQPTARPRSGDSRTRDNGYEK